MWKLILLIAMGTSQGQASLPGAFPSYVVCMAQGAVIQALSRPATLVVGFNCILFSET